ncbi:MAG TPA: DUF3667 domain-containing protein [Sphingomicrobium sp.]
MASSTVWTCPACKRVRRTLFCPQCGEERLRPHDLSARDVAAQMAKGFSTIDGKLLRSFRSILTAPGTLTAAHVAGRRRTFIGPLALFFIANALFVGVQSLTGTNILSTPLDSHLHHQDWSALARTMVQDRLSASHQTLGGLTPAFDQAAIFNAKALMILMVLAFTPFLFLAFGRTDRPAGAQAVFALHLYAFVLILLCVAVLVAEAELLAGGAGIRSPVVDVGLALLSIMACAAYIYAAIGPAYGATGGKRVAKALILTAIVAALFVGYRFAIFVITLYSV